MKNIQISLHMPKVLHI